MLIDVLGSAEGRASDADARAAYWQSVAERQAAELQRQLAANLVLQERTRRLEARCRVLGLTAAAAAYFAPDTADIEIDPKVLSQQMDRAHNQG